MKNIYLIRFQAYNYNDCIQGRPTGYFWFTCQLNTPEEAKKAFGRFRRLWKRVQKNKEDKNNTPYNPSLDSHMETFYREMDYKYGEFDRMESEPELYNVNFTKININENN